MNLDHSVYPDLDSPPEDLITAEDRADYVQRVCSHWDYGLVPEPDTVAVLPLALSPRVLSISLAK